MAIAIDGTGTITGISVGGLNDSIITSSELANGAVTAAKIGYAGAILQIQEFTLTTQPSTNSVDSFVDVTGWSDTITPSATGSKILITINIGRVSKSDDNNRLCPFRIMRDINGGGYSAIGVGAAAGNRLLASFAISNTPGNYGLSGGYIFLDSPSTTSVCTYKLQWTGQDGETWYINRSGGDENSTDTPHTRTMSTMYLLEVAA